MIACWPPLLLLSSLTETSLLCAHKREGGTFPNCAIILPVYHWQIKDTIHLIEHLLHTRPHLERLYFFAVFCSLWFITTVFCRLIHLETVMHRQHNQTSLFAWLPFLDSYYFFSFIWLMIGSIIYLAYFLSSSFAFKCISNRLRLESGMSLLKRKEKDGYNSHMHNKWAIMLFVCYSFLLTGNVKLENTKKIVLNVSEWHSNCYQKTEQ